MRVLLLLAFLPVIAAAQLPPDVFIVVEEGGRNVVLLESGRTEPGQRFTLSHAIHGEPKFAPDGRHALFASRDGWISRLDLANGVVTAQVRAASEIRGIAVSSDGKFIAVASSAPPALLILDADLKLRKTLPSFSVAPAVYDAGRRRSFVVSFEDVPELWEVSYDPAAQPIAEGLVHDFSLKEGSFVEGFLNPRRTRLERPLGDLYFAHGGSQAIGAERGSALSRVVQLDVRRAIAQLPGRLFAGATWLRNGRRLIAARDARKGGVTIIDAEDWKVEKQIPTAGPGSFVHSHAATPYLWADAAKGGNLSDTLHVIDRETLEVVASFTEPGGKIAQVEFDGNGRHAFASLHGPNAALIVFDAHSLREVKRIALATAGRAYNLSNRSRPPD